VSVSGDWQSIRAGEKFVPRPLVSHQSRKEKTPQPKNNPIWPSYALSPRPISRRFPPRTAVYARCQPRKLKVKFYIASALPPSYTLSGSKTWPTPDIAIVRLLDWDLSGVRIDIPLYLIFFVNSYHFFLILVCNVP
jgi:hypothetical protein